jgi:hypothetical protein
MDGGTILATLIFAAIILVWSYFSGLFGRKK